MEVSRARAESPLLCPSVLQNALVAWPECGLDKGGGAARGPWATSAPCLPTPVGFVLCWLLLSLLAPQSTRPPEDWPLQALGSLRTVGRGPCHCTGPREPDTADGLVLSLRSPGRAAESDCPRAGQGRREMARACSDPHASACLLRPLCRALHTRQPLGSSQPGALLVPVVQTGLRL